MRYSALTSRLVARAARLKVGADASGRVDGIAAEQALVAVLQELAERWNIDVLTVIQGKLFTTVAGVTTYPLPPDFGAPLLPAHGDQCWLWLNRNDDQPMQPLTYQEPAEFGRFQPLTTGRPGHVTRSPQGVVLSPPPDDNAGANYAVHASYTRQIDFNTFDFDEQISIPQVQALEDAALARMQGQVDLKAMTTLVHGSRRGKTQFNRRNTWNRVGVRN